MEIGDENQELSADELANLEKEIQRYELARRMEDKNIAIKQESGYFEAVSYNAAIDRWRKDNKDGYAASRRKKAEKEAADDGRTLRAYKPATPERRREQQRNSKRRQRKDSDFAEAEQKKNTAAKQAARNAMTDAEREEANRIRREKYKANKARKADEAAADIEGRTIF